MPFEVTALLGNLFGGGPAMATVAVVPGPDDGGGRFADWVRRPDCHGRMGWERPDLPEMERWWARCDFESLSEPNPVCTVCGNLEQWQDLLRRQRCGVCERTTLDKALQLAARAARLRTVKMGNGRLQKDATFCAENKDRNTVVDNSATNE